MSKYTVTVRGHRREWVFDIGNAEPQHIEQWRADGLVIDEVVNTIPDWAVTLGLTHLWCVVQDIFK